MSTGYFNIYTGGSQGLTSLYFGITVGVLLERPYHRKGGNSMEIFTSGFFIVLYIAIVLFTMFCYFRIITKAGYAWEYGILALIPALNIIWFFIFAFDTWPIEETLKKNNNKPHQKRGTPQVVPTASVELKPTTNFCSNCGDKLTPGVKFCPNCGNKIGQTN